MAGLEAEQRQVVPALDILGVAADDRHRRGLSLLDPAERGKFLASADKLQMVPGTKLAKLPGGDEDEIDDPIPEVTVLEVRRLADLAMSKALDVEMVYLAKNGLKLELIVEPERFAFKGDSPVLVGIDRAEDERRTFVLERIERMRVLGLDE